MTRKIAVVTTTIRVPEFLIGISENAVANDRTDITFYIIGDVKTPNKAIELCNSLNDKYPFSYLYFGIKDQEKKLSDFPELLKLIPYNSGVRKLLGNVIAYLDGADTVIQVDDDNFVTDDDFVGSHCIVDREIDIQLIESETGWFNVYEPLREKNNIPFFPRGFPWSERDYYGKVRIKNIRKKAKIVVLNGLVYEDPDVDAISRLFWPIRVVGIDPEYTPNYGLHPGTWSSFNNQNTSTSRELTRVYFTPQAGERNADIWASFVICRLVEHCGDVIAFGSPFVKQLRNPHDFWEDLDGELTSNKMTDIFVHSLRSVELESTNYLNALGELIDKCIQKLGDTNDLEEVGYSMILNFFREYQVWYEIFTRIRKDEQNKSVT